MNPQSRIMLALGRIAAVTSILRTRSEQATRDELNGVSTPELKQRIDKMANQVESLASELERSVA